MVNCREAKICQLLLPLCLFFAPMSLSPVLIWQVPSKPVCFHVSLEWLLKLTVQDNTKGKVDFLNVADPQACVLLQVWDVWVERVKFIIVYCFFFCIPGAYNTLWHVFGHYLAKYFLKFNFFLAFKNWRKAT